MARAPSDEVVAAAQEAQRRWAIPASISIAQWALESGWGKHDLGCFNYFGMKAPCGRDGQPTCAFVTKRTREVDWHGQEYFIDAPFRSFASAREAFIAHAELLATGRSYTAARACLPDPLAFADALTGTYATDPSYGKALRAIIMGAELTRYDLGNEGASRHTRSARAE